MYKDSVKKKVRILLTILKFAVLLLIIVAIPLIVYLKFPYILAEFKSIEQVNALLDRYQTAGIVFYMGFQVAQVVVSIIPGQPLQFAAGYAFGILLGFGASIVGIAVGTVLTYLLGRIFGKDMVYLVFGKERLERFIQMLDSKKAFIIVFLLYLIPGIPKDVFSYAAGISNMRMVPFLVLSMVGRAPALLCSIMIGHMLRTQSYVGIIVVAALVIIATGIAFIRRKRIHAFIDRMYEKAVHKQ